MTREEAIVVLKAFMDNPLFSDVHRATFSIAIHDIKQRHEWDINKLMLVSKTEWEQEPTTKNNLGVDTISRADARKAIIDHQYSNNFCEEHNIDHSINTSMALIALSDLPPVTPQEPRWIPVSERLPKPFMYVNATCRSLVDDREDWVVETIYSPIPKEANKHGYSDWGNIPMLNWGEAEVIAWVERIIPQPYKAESEG